MSRECCGPELPVGDTDTTSHLEAPDDMVPWWRDPALAFPASSGLLLAAGYIAQWLGGINLGAVLFSVSLAAGAWTFAPSAIRNLFLHRFLGVGLLMTIAAIGAVLLGHVGEAAALAFLFSIAEGLEDRAMDRAKHGLSALLSLIPQTARISSLNGDRTVAAADTRDGRGVETRPTGDHDAVSPSLSRLDPATRCWPDRSTASGRFTSKPAPMEPTTH